MRFFILLSLCLFSLFSCAAQIENNSAEQVLNFWFGDLHSSEDYPQEKSKIWFGGGPQIDQEIRDRFEHLLLKAQNDELEDWKNTPKGRLALIILVDQFPRNMYRGTPKAFAFDAIAQDLTHEGLAHGEDLLLYPIERAFFYLPLEHAESLPLQELSIEKFRQLVKDAPSSATQVFESYLKYAVEHYDIIARFGRFPHRNAILGRESTIEENQFLRGDNSSF